jgi:pantoate--beta-alanine ligase
MQTITTIHAMQTWADATRTRGERIGLVPTMGYLHAGHLSLVAEARRHADRVAASIFVNPLQFGPSEDLARYPRDLERDTAMLTDAGTDVLYLPTVSEMYPEGSQTTVTVEHVTQGLCGDSRPGHFRGVTTVVAKLFNAVKPHVAVFGQKDFQQLVAIRRMARDLDFDIEIIAAPIVREPDGLAMSSRNAYLSPEERRAARCLSHALQLAEAAAQRGEANAAAIRQLAASAIATEPRARIDYIAVVDPDTMRPVDQITGPTLLALAVFIGLTRLIDNTVLKGSLSRMGEGQGEGEARSASHLVSLGR